MAVCQAEIDRPAIPDVGMVTEGTLEELRANYQLEANEKARLLWADTIAKLVGVNEDLLSQIASLVKYAQRSRQKITKLYRWNTMLGAAFTIGAILEAVSLIKRWL